MGQDMALLQTDSLWGRTAVRIMFLVLMAVFLSTESLFIGSSYAQEKDAILSDSGIVYPGGYDLNTVGNIQGKVSGVVIPESGPVRITLIADKETYFVLASPRSFWNDMDADLKIGIEVNVRGSKSVGKDGNLYIIAQEIKVTGSKKILVFRSESGEALWRGGYQAGRTGSQGSGFGSSGGFGSSSSGRAGAGSSGAGRGRR
jgi:uncharacterized membrane protein YgcG